MTPGPKSQLLAGIVVDSTPGPVSIGAAALYNAESVAVLLLTISESHFLKQFYF